MSTRAAAVAVILVLLASHWGAYEHGRSVELTQASQALAQRDSRDRLAEVMGERSARQEEQRRATAHEEARVHAMEERTIADAGADAAGQRLHDEAGKFSSAVSCPGTDTAALTRGQAATRAAMVLPHLLARADARAGELAQAYDYSRIAGEQCQREFDSLRGG